MTVQQRQPALFLSMPHRCSYFPERSATMLFIDPQHPPGDRIYDKLVTLGFRRSGDFIYRPHCQHCSDCISVRISTQEFQATRGQRRCWRRNQDIEVNNAGTGFDDEHFALYQRYQTTRHPGGGMEDPNPEKYIEFLNSRYTDTEFYEFRLQGVLLAVAVTDVLYDGLSAVYTFFDPEQTQRGLGVYAILWQIEQAKQLGLPYLYLGYWIEDCKKMAYKANYAPLEAYKNQHWALLKK